jgi:integrase
MPAQYEMKWLPKHRLWRRMLHGKRYVVSCRQLSKWAGKPVPETKEGSYQIANAWWRAKSIEIGGSPPPPQPHADYIEEYRQKLRIAKQYGEHHVADALASEIARVEKGGLPSYLCEPDISDFEAWADTSSPIEEPPLDDEALEQRFLNYEIEEAFNPFSKVWEDRLARERRSNVPPERTVSALVERYLKRERNRYDAGQISLSEYDLVSRYLEAFRDWIGAESPVEVINAERWDDYYGHLLQLAKSVEYKKKRLRYAKVFIEWTISMALIPPLPNLHNRKYRFGGRAKVPPIMTADEVRRLIKEAPGQLKLHLLLMANCGMTQKDISDLRQDEVDWSDGRIVRKRSKTADKKNVPTVNYKLWPETWALLQHYRQTEGDRVLLTNSGLQWVREWPGDDGKKHKTDAIASNYKHLRKRLSFGKSLKVFRKTSPTLMDRHEIYGRLWRLFLGQAPRGIAEINYINREGRFTLFDEAVEWLGRQYGFMDGV